MQAFKKTYLQNTVEVCVEKKMVAVAKSAVLIFAILKRSWCRCQMPFIHFDWICSKAATQTAWFDERGQYRTHRNKLCWIEWGRSSLWMVWSVVMVTFRKKLNIKTKCKANDISCSLISKNFVCSAVFSCVPGAKPPKKKKETNPQ